MTIIIIRHVHERGKGAFVFYLEMLFVAGGGEEEEEGFM